MVTMETGPNISTIRSRSNFAIQLLSSFSGRARGREKSFYVSESVHFALHLVSIEDTQLTTSYWGVLIYKSVSDLNITIVQPRHLNLGAELLFLGQISLLFVLHATKTVPLIS